MNILSIENGITVTGYGYENFRCGLVLDNGTIRFIRDRILATGSKKHLSDSEEIINALLDIIEEQKCK